MSLFHLSFEKRLLPGSNLHLSAMLEPTFELIFTVKPMIRIVNRTSIVTTVTLRSTKGSGGLGTLTTATLRPNAAFNALEKPDVLNDHLNPLCLELDMVLDNNMELKSDRGIPLPLTSMWVAMSDLLSRRIYIKVEKVADETFEFSFVAVLVNALPYPIEIYAVTPKPGGSLVAGQSEGGIGVLNGGQLPLSYTSEEETRRAKSPLSVRIRIGRSGVKCSGPLICSEPAPPVTLLCEDAHLVHRFTARRSVADVRNGGYALAGFATISIEPTWFVENCSDEGCVLSIRSLGLEDHTLTLVRNCRSPLMTFHNKNVQDPHIQVAFPSPAGAMFSWSAAVCLSKLCATTSTVYVRHEADPTLVGAPECPFSATSIKGAQHRFSCITLQALPCDDAMVIRCRLEANSVPVVIENRTPVELSFHNILEPHREFSAGPFEDAPYCWPAFPHEGIFVITASPGGSKKSKYFTFSVDVLRDSATSEGKSISTGLCCICTFDTSTKRYVISVVKDRLLESRLVNQSLSVVNVQMFVQNAIVHLASQAQCKSVSDCPVAAEAAEGNIQMPVGFPWKQASPVDRVAAVAKMELDIVAVQLRNLGCDVSTNGKHVLGEFEVGLIGLHNCAVPKPLHPVLLKCGSPSLADPPAISSRLHLERSAVFYDETIQALTIKYLLLTMQPLYIYADDRNNVALR